jgi:hypothetical protein
LTGDSLRSSIFSSNLARTQHDLAASVVNWREQFWYLGDVSGLVAYGGQAGRGRVRASVQFGLVCQCRMKRSKVDTRLVAFLYPKTVSVAVALRAKVSITQFYICVSRIVAATLTLAIRSSLGSLGKIVSCAIWLVFA